MYGDDTHTHTRIRTCARKMPIAFSRTSKTRRVSDRPSDHSAFIAERHRRSSPRIVVVVVVVVAFAGHEFHRAIPARSYCRLRPSRLAAAAAPASPPPPPPPLAL